MADTLYVVGGGDGDGERGAEFGGEVNNVNFPLCIMLRITDGSAFGKRSDNL